MLSTKPRISCSEFIQAIEKKGIHVRFNVASTGYVSRISYSFKDLIVTGSKLGNDVKWTTLRNRLDYQQEKDRAIIQLANTRIQANKVNSGTSLKSKQSDNIMSHGPDVHYWPIMHL